MPAKSTEFLYTPPPVAHDYEEELLAWHKRMSAEYKPADRSQPPIVLYHWLRRAGIERDRMAKYGINVSSLGNVPSYESEAYRAIFDHARVIKRRSDGAVFILAEPYTDLSRLENHPCLQAWRELGSEVICSKESGWMPRNTVSALIGEPRGNGAKKKEDATK